MSGTSLQPQTGNRAVMRRQEDGNPFLPFRRQMSRLFDDFFTGPLLSSFPTVVPTPMLDVVVTPQVEVSETDKEIRITAELPGIDPANVEVSLNDDVLTIRGEKQQQREEDGGKDRDYHLSERSYGTFARYLRLPFEPEPDKIQASFKDGVLTIIVPKPEEAQQKVHRISVNTDAQTSGGSQDSQTNGGSQPSAKSPSQQAAAAE